jgi:lysophospholipase L1-like esterase
MILKNLTSWFLRACLILVPSAGICQQPGVAFWENDIRKFEHLDSTENYSNDAVLFTGSSSIRLWDSLAKDMAPYEVIRRGYGGAKLSDYLVYAKRIIYSHPGKAIVIFIANDITGMPGDKTPGQVGEMARQLLAVIREKFPSEPVFWIEITPTSSRWKAWPEIQKANLEIEKACHGDAYASFIHTAWAFFNDQELPRDELFREDKLHLNPEGYKVWTGIIKKELDVRLKAN